MIKIVQKENKVLRKQATPVSVDEITSDYIKKILSDMKDALDSQADGVALAAPQIDMSLRIFIVSKRAFEVNDSDEDIAPKESGDLIFINPDIVKLSKKKSWMEEGCLSVRWLYGQTKRSINATVTAYDENGVKFTRGAGGLLAQIFQHEIDHLNGILFIDNAKEIEEIPPEKQRTLNSNE